MAAPDNGPPVKSSEAGPDWPYPDERVSCGGCKHRDDWRCLKKSVPGRSVGHVPVSLKHFCADYAGMRRTL